MKKKVLKELLNTGLYLLFVLVATWLLVNFVVQRTQVEGGSMESTLYTNDNLLVDKISYRLSDPKRFDIIVFPFGELHYIKRIIGMPGETVQIDEEGRIYIDGEVLQESYGKEVIKPENIGRAAEPIKLGDDEYFVMGDNRNHSSDSRTEAVGNIHRNDIVGRAWVRIWPLSSFGPLKHG